jgi:hypothetical protein
MDPVSSHEIPSARRNDSAGPPKCLDMYGQLQEDFTVRSRLNFHLGRTTA